MATSYVHRYIIVVTAAKVSVANNRAKTWDSAPRGDLTFGSVGLSASGSAPATHYICNTAATESMKTQILQALDNVPFIDVFNTADGWTYESVLASLNLKLVTVGNP